jgi:hypothetical protein
MNKTVLLLICAVLVLSTAAFATRPHVTLGPGTGGANFRVPFHQTTNVVLSSDTTYVLTGWYFVDSTYSLTVPAGTVIRGDSASGGTLIVSRGAKLFATGTKDKPVIFTSNKPAGTRVPGDWGGVIILGNAPTNKPTTQQIEGGFGTIPNSFAMYGGPDSLDNSGVLTYVRIEFGGIAFAQDNEINGLTFGGVGAGTTVHHVQVSFANDDDFEFFGGTVQAKYLIGWCSLDDTYDTDFGFNGRLQFCYTKRDPNIFDASASGSSNGFESDNEGSSPYAATPRTKTRVSNMTLVGPQQDTTDVINSRWGYSAMLRRATEFSVYNSVLMGWKNGINVRDTLTQRAAIDNRLEIRNTSLQTMAANTVVASSSPATGNIAGFDVKAWFRGDAPYAPTGNKGDTARNVSDMGFSAALFNLDSTNNPVPSPTSEAATAGTSYQGRLGGDAWFDSVGYRGAFDPSLARDQQWDWGWANYEPNDYDPENPNTIAANVIDGWNLVSVPMREVADPSVLGVFPTATSAAFQYNGSYTTSPTLTHGPGYWLKFSGAQTVNVGGFASILDTIGVSAKWNIVGSVAVPVSVSNIVSNPPGNIVSSYYGYNGGYSVATTLVPGQGYWVKATGAGSIALNGYGGAMVPKASQVLPVDQFNAITVADSRGHSQTLYVAIAELDKSALDMYELPPTPPAGSFDVRFASQRMLESVPTVGGGNEYPLVLSGAAYPVSVTIDAKQLGGASVELVEKRGETVLAVHRLADGKSVTVASGSSLSIRVGSGSAVPTSFAISQNYPNPFNPSTRINIDVPQDGFVDVSVFDVLGQKVSTLFNGEIHAGYKTLEWNGTNNLGATVPSGMYFVRMNSDKFSGVRKMMLMK